MVFEIFKNNTVASINNKQVNAILNSTERL